MTIAVIWLEDECLWCAADTRLVAGSEDDPVSEIGSKIFAIPVAVSEIVESGTRAPHYSTEYGFVFAGSALPAIGTAATASTLLARLGSKNGHSDPPRFEHIAEFVHRLAQRFMQDRRRFGGDGKFSAALFGWCSHSKTYQVAQIDGRDDAGSFRVELTFPAKPKLDGNPWLVLGNGRIAFSKAIENYKTSEHHVSKRVPRRVIDKMIAENWDPTVGGSTSVGFAHKHGFELLFTLEPTGNQSARRMFNGLDQDTEIGEIFPYKVATFGAA